MADAYIAVRPPRTCPFSTTPSEVGIICLRLTCRSVPRMLGIEMDKGNAEVCRPNIAPFGTRCELLVGAAWKEDGEVAYGGDAEWGYSIISEYCGSSRRVRTFSMPSLIDRIGVARVDFVKMDIEGPELEVLADAWKWSDRVGCLKVEVHRLIR